MNRNRKHVIRDKVSERNRNIPWGIIYLLLIPLFGLIYHLLPDGYLIYDQLEDTYLTNLYFSAVTITTLGFGDIVPANNIASTLLAAECICGVISVGLFLNNLSYKKDLELSADEEKRDKISAYQYERNKTIQFDRVVRVAIERYENTVREILDDDETSVRLVSSGEQIGINALTGLFRTHTTPDDFSIPRTNAYYLFAYAKVMIKRIEELVREIDMKNWPVFDRLCAEFLSRASKIGEYEDFFTSIKADSSRAAALTSALQGTNGNELPEELMLQSDGRSTDIAPFKMLCGSLSYTGRFLIEYRKWIDQITITDAEAACEGLFCEMKGIYPDEVK